jgi:chemotaxis protein MotA
MKAGTAIGIIVAIVAIGAGATLEGANVMAVFNLPAILIVVVGTLGVTIGAVGLDRMKAVPTLYKKVFAAEQPDYAGRVDQLVDLAERARKEGLLALDEQLGEIDDQFTRKGMQLVVDGTDPEVVREILDSEIAAMEGRHHNGAETFKQAGGFAPTMGVLGTVMGLVHVLENLDKPETLGPSIAGAFIATLLGVGIANVVFLPVGNRLGDLSKEEVALRELTIEGIMAIQAGENPRIVREKLTSWVPPAQRVDPEAAKAAAAGEPGRDTRMAEAA